MKAFVGIFLLALVMGAMASQLTPLKSHLLLGKAGSTLKCRLFNDSLSLEAKIYKKCPAKDDDCRAKSTARANAIRAKMALLSGCVETNATPQPIVTPAPAPLPPKEKSTKSALPTVDLATATQKTDGTDPTLPN